MKRMDWRQKLLISILGSFIVIMSLMFYGTYYYFINKIETSNEKVVLLTFEQAEKELKNMLENAELCLDKYVTDDFVWRFGCEDPENDIEKSKLLVKLTQKFSDEMAINRHIASLGILRGDGNGIVSLAAGKNRTGKTSLSEELQNVLHLSKKNHPYTIWIPSWELHFEESDLMSLTTQAPSMIGIKAMGESEKIEKEIFLFTAIDENTLGNTYESVAFNNSTAVLVDRNGQIISSVGDSILGETYSVGKSTQNIEYSLSFYDWKLCDMIPKKQYMRDANDIRNFGVAVIGAAILATAVVAVIWSRKYTRPIELLMENMNHVKKQEFAIEKPKKLGWEELDQLNLEFYYMAQSIRQYIDRLQLAEREKAEEELLALRYQMNPHFLLNSLNSIRWMAMMTNNTIVADTLVTLSRIITPMLRNPGLTWKISDEIDFLENYVAMMQLRYGHDMEYHMNCPIEFYDKEFPQLILQPLIENCFVHGSKQGEVRSIDVIIHCDEYIEVKVINSGVFLSEEELQQIYSKMQTSARASGNIGLANVHKRLQLLYGKLGYIVLETDAELGFICHICFPENPKMLSEI